MACSAPTTLFFLAVVYGIITAATFATLYMIYQHRINELSIQCSKFQDIHEIEIGTKIVETIVADTSTSSQDRPKPSSIEGVRYSECICPSESVTENPDDRLSRDSTVLSGTRESPLLRCCSSNDTILQEVGHTC